MWKTDQPKAANIQIDKTDRDCAKRVTRTVATPRTGQRTCTSTHDAHHATAHCKRKKNIPHPPTPRPFSPNSNQKPPPPRQHWIESAQTAFRARTESGFPSPAPCFLPLSPRTSSFSRGLLAWRSLLGWSFGSNSADPLSLTSPT